MHYNIYDILEDPFSSFLPENTQYCTRQEIDKLHQKTCSILSIDDIYPKILWKFTPNLRKCLAEASYWEDTSGEMHWQITYDTKAWISMGTEGRKNTIIHEVCHLAVEKLYGHNNRPKKNEIAVTDHGRHWQQLMIKCNEDPFMPQEYKYR